MLIALFTILLLGGSSTGMLDFIADSRDEVKVVMERGERRTDALSTLKAMKRRTDARNKVVKRSAEELTWLLSQDDIQESDFDIIWFRYFAERKAYNEDMLDLRFQLKEQLTREEWEQVFSDN